MRQWRERKCTNFETVAKGDSNPDSLDCASDILPLSYRVPPIRTTSLTIFTTSLTTGTTPSFWRTANIVAIFKKGSNMSTENYRPVSLTSVVCKIESISSIATL